MEGFQVGHAPVRFSFRESSLVSVWGVALEGEERERQTVIVYVRG